MLAILATAASSGISAEQVGIIIGSIIIALIGGGVLGKKVADTQRVRLSEPVPTITTRKHREPPSWDQHKELEHRVTTLEQAQAEFRRDLAQHYREMLEAGGARENRIMDKLDGIARGIHNRIDEQLKTCATRLCSPPTARK